MPLGLLLLLGLAVYRATVLVTTDRLTAGFRRRLVRRFPARIVPLVDDSGEDLPGSAMAQPRWPVVLTSCDWCLSVWLAAFAVVGAYSAGLVESRAETAYAWGAVAAIAGITSEVVSFLTRP